MKRNFSLLLVTSMLLVLSCTDSGIQDDLDRAAALKDENSPAQNIPPVHWRCNMLTNTANLSYDFYAFGDDFVYGHSGQENPFTDEVVPVEYNAQGNPVKIRNYHVPFDSTVYVLTYTSLLQLKRIVKRGYHHMVDGFDYNTTYNFTYSGSTLTVDITTVANNGTPSFDDGSLKFYFDTEGRIKEKKHYTVSTDATPHHIMKYAYNAAGNLANILYIVPNEGQKKIAEFYSYDNEKNIYGSNKVWQLLFEQYSKNNPTYYVKWNAVSTTKHRELITYTYNGLGYPTHLDIQSSNFNFTTNQWAPLHGTHADVEYDCYGTLL
jgi:hypothetical protein